jgi:diacylglycerol kinase (ATP)
MAKSQFSEPPEFEEPSGLTSKPKRACLVVNPVSGVSTPDNQARYESIWSTLRASGIWAEVVETRPDEPPGDIAKRAAEEGYSMVIVCGGDGTVGATAKGLVGTECPLGILPMGTYNNFARSLGVPLDMRRACKVLARGRIRRVDVGVANDDHYFFEAAGVGIDAQLFPLGEEIKSGRWSRLWQAAKLAYQAEPARIRFELDLPLAEAYHSGSEKGVVRPAARPFASNGKRELDFSAFLLIIANGRYYGSGFTVAPDAVMDDGLFNIRIFRNFSKHELLRHFWSISRRRYCYSPKIDTFTASEITITAKADLPFHVDGYSVGRLPLKLSTRRRALKVLA